MPRADMGMWCHVRTHHQHPEEEGEVVTLLGDNSDLQGNSSSRP